MEAVGLDGIFDSMKFEKLNENDVGVTFTFLTDDRISALQISSAEFKARTEGIPPKGRFDGFFLVNIGFQKGDLPVVIGLDRVSGRVLTTSPIASLAPDLSAVKTENSLYTLSDHMTGDMPWEYMASLIYALRYWGYSSIVKNFPEIAY